MSMTHTFSELNALSYHMFDKKHDGSCLRTFLENQEIIESMRHRQFLPSFLILAHLITAD